MIKSVQRRSKCQSVNTVSNLRHIANVTGVIHMRRKVKRITTKQINALNVATQLSMICAQSAITLRKRLNKSKILFSPTHFDDYFDK